MYLNIVIRASTCRYAVDTGLRLDVGIVSRIRKSRCPKCNLLKKSGQLSCCARGAAWFKKCGDPGDSRFEHTWLQGKQACNSKFVLCQTTCLQAHRLCFNCLLPMPMCQHDQTRDIPRKRQHQETHDSPRHQQAPRDVPSVAPRNLVSSVVALAVVLGSRIVEIPATRVLSTRGLRESRHVKVRP